MDSLRAAQLLSDAAYIVLGVIAVRAALRWPDRVRSDVALLFGAVAAAVILQELSGLPCCQHLPGVTNLASILVLAMPYLLLRLLDDVVDVPPAATFAALGLLVPSAALSFVPGAAASGWYPVLVLTYLLCGTLYAAWGFVGRARAAPGITRRRMWAVALACGLLAATFAAALAVRFAPAQEVALTIVSRLAALLSGVCFSAGFFPPTWLREAWRLPELLDYLRPSHAQRGAEATGELALGGPAADAMALERLSAAVARTTGAHRALLALEDPSRGDLYLWGAPLARLGREEGLIGRVFASGEAMVLRHLRPEQLARSVLNVLAGERLPRSVIAVPVVLEGRRVGVLCAYADKAPMFVKDDLDMVRFFATDVAAILQTRQYRESAHELAVLREADRLKDEFMAVVSHELRTPLTAISGYADILLRKLSGPLTERQERQVSGIRDAARRLLALINDLLDVSKLETGTVDLHLTAADPDAAIQRAVAGTRVIAATKGVHLEVRSPEQLLPPVLADEERLQQILLNLLANAIKFTPQDGLVWIGATAAMNEHGTEIVFRVQDTGVGLVPEQLARVWDRFYQAESASTRRFSGAGLGLSIVQRLVELHGGRAEAASAGLNQGSTFIVRLPSATTQAAITRAPTPSARMAPTPPPSGSTSPEVAAAAAAAEPDSATAGVGGSPVVLVVEDDEDIAAVLRTYLEADGYQVEVAGDGQQALSLVRECRPFAITLDISLPKLDGWSVMNALKRDPSSASIPVVVVSIVDNKDFGMVLGAIDYLVKPVDHERLLRALRQISTLPETPDGPILIVDDDPAVLDVLGSSLAADGWRVVTASDGESALATVAAERPRAMVLDLMMPQVNGFEVLRTVRADPETRNLPVIVVTAHDLTEQDRARLAGAAQRVLLKQALSMDDLRRELRDVLASQRPADSSNGRS
jgi:signal transduction histidine kinase/CheY-like chemotaxis protein